MARNFHLIETLGEGAFGVVHLARVSDDEGFVQRLAVKMLHQHYSADTDLARRLRDEARLLALLEHDHIVRVHGLTRIDGRLAILMEPIPGADLSSCEGEPMPPRVALEVVEAAASALRAAWETVPPGEDEPLRVVHRDIKPSNIMVTSRGGVKVMDFGVARARFDHRESSTQSQQFGTARYMAPERWLEGTAEAPSDIFSLGVTLLELLSGIALSRPRLARSSFEEDIREAAESIALPGLRDLVLAMCSFLPGDRPTAEQVVAECRRLCELCPAPSLREWAETWVPSHRADRVRSADARFDEDVSGETFVADVPAATGTSPSPLVAPTVDTATANTEALPRPTSARRGFLWGISAALFALMLWFNRGILGIGASVEAPDDVRPALGTAAEAAPLGLTLGPASSPVALAPSLQPEPTRGLAPDTEPPPAVASDVQPRVVAPEPARPSSPRPAPQPEPAAPTVAPSPVPTSTVTFALNPPTLSAQTASGALVHRSAARLPLGVHEVRVDGAAGPWQCTVRIDGATGAWRVDDTHRECTRIQ